MKSKIRISSGTCAVCGLSKLKPKAPPTTAYLMLGEKCSNNCQFCTQSISSTSNAGLLSRVDWLNFDIETILEHTNQAFNDGKLKRMCLQVVDTAASFNDTLATIKKITSHSNIPICASSTVKDVETARILFENGLDKLCIALDAVTRELYLRIKGNDFNQKLNFIIQLSSAFPGKITTHVIAGLGETEFEMAQMLSTLSGNKITVALFAFTPVKGTPMESHPRPALSAYRRIQIINYLLQNSHISLNDIIFENEEIKGFSPNHNPKIIDIINSSNGQCFRTSGCPDCNRPYYNDSPSETPYNYPYKPNTTEIADAISICGLFE